MVIRLALSLSFIIAWTTSGDCAEIPEFSQAETEIRKTVESYVDAYNRGAASAAASHWSKYGSYLTDNGKKVKGPDEIRPALENFFFRA